MEKQLNIPALQAAMDTKGLNQSKLAKALGVSPTSVSQWVMGAKMPRPDKLLKLGMLLRLPFNQLVILPPNPAKPVVSFHRLNQGENKEGCTMGGSCTEADWKYMRSIQPELLDKLARQINGVTAKILLSPKLQEIGKYRAVCQHLKESDQIVSRCFDDWRRSTLLPRLLAIHREGLLTEEQLQNLSPQAQECLKTLSK